MAGTYTFAILINACQIRGPQESSRISNIDVLLLGFFVFDVKALTPQGLTERPNYFRLFNNLMTLIISESLKEIGEMARVTSARSSHGQRCGSRLQIASFAKELEFLQSKMGAFPPVYVTKFNLSQSLTTNKSSDVGNE